MSILTKLSAIWAISQEDTQDVLDSLTADRWAGQDGLEAVAYAGVIDHNNNPHKLNKLHGHNGYWIADADEHVGFILNSNTTWCDWSEECAQDIHLPWGDFFEVMQKHMI